MYKIHVNININKKNKATVKKIRGEYTVEREFNVAKELTFILPFTAWDLLCGKCKATAAKCWHPDALLLFVLRSLR